MIMHICNIGFVSLGKQKSPGNNQNNQSNQKQWSLCPPFIRNLNKTYLLKLEIVLFN